jgi:hypothetical protein
MLVVYPVYTLVGNIPSIESYCIHTFYSQHYIYIYIYIYAARVFTRSHSVRELTFLAVFDAAITSTFFQNHLTTVNTRLRSIQHSSFPTLKTHIRDLLQRGEDDCCPYRYEEML